MSDFEGSAAELAVRATRVVKVLREHRAFLMQRYGRHQLCPALAERCLCTVCSLIALPYRVCRVYLFHEGVVILPATLHHFLYLRMLRCAQCSMRVPDCVEVLRLAVFGVLSELLGVRC